MPNSVKICSFLYVFIFGVIIFGQSTVNTTPPPNSVNTNPPDINILNDPTRISSSIRESIDGVSGSGAGARMRGGMTEKQREEFILKKETEMLGGDRSPLVVPSEYYTKFTGVLKDKKTGLARLFPEMNCYRGMTVSINEGERCDEALPIIGNGSYYSFRMKSNLKNARPEQNLNVFQAGEWNDIHYVNGKFKVGGETIQGMITELPNVDIFNLDDKSVYIRSLKKYKSQKKFSEIEEQKKQIKNGISVGGLRYFDSISMKHKTTYILRSIAYLINLHSGRISSGIYTFPNLRSEVRTDAVIGFQVVGQEDDGSIIILWKQFSVKDSPVMVLNK